MWINEAPMTREEVTDSTLTLDCVISGLKRSLGEPIGKGGG